MIIESYIPYGGGLNIPDTIVVHAMGEFISTGNSEKHAVAFLNDYKLSAHVLISPNGDKYICHPDNEIAWHARGHNTNSLGIEFLVKGIHDYESFLNKIKTSYTTTEQLDSGIEIIQKWINIHNIIDDKIVQHSYISPDRKVDPGIGFPWEILKSRIENGL